MGEAESREPETRDREGSRDKEQGEKTGSRRQKQRARDKDKEPEPKTGDRDRQRPEQRDKRQRPEPEHGTGNRSGNWGKEQKAVREVGCVNGDGNGGANPEGQRSVWLIGDAQGWVASAVIDQHLSVRWAARAEEVPTSPSKADAGILVLSRNEPIPVDLLAQLAPAWTILQSGPSFGGRRTERAAAAALSVVPGVRFVPLPDQPWTNRARVAGIQTRESLAEILAALGLAGIVPAEALPGAGRRKTG